MNPSTASNRLKKMLLFEFAKQLDKDVCHQCCKKIEKIEEFSVEHKEPWLDSEDPQGLYFDLDNIAFSHLHCNVKASRPGTKVMPAKDVKGWYKYKSGRNKPYRVIFRYKNKAHEGGYYETEDEAREAYLKLRDEVMNDLI